MKTISIKYSFQKKFHSLIIMCILLVSAIAVRGQYVEPPSVCYGEPIYLYCGGAPGCDIAGAIFSWTDPTGSWTSNEKNPEIYVGTPGYHSGTYFLSILYPPNLVYSGSASVTVSDEILISGYSQPISCNGDANGSLTLSVTNYFQYVASYNWSNGAFTRDISGLSAGVYTVTVTDGRPCTKVESWVVVQPSEISMETTSVMASCEGAFNGTITTTIKGGAGGLTTYLWSDGQTGSAAFNLSSGTYTVTIMNGAGCEFVSPPVFVGATDHDLPDPAGIISGPTHAKAGQTGIVYSVTPIANATSYHWSLPPGATFNVVQPGTISVDYSSLATSGNISVYGTNGCGNGQTSPDMGITVVPMNLELPTGTIGAGDADCYDAIQTVYVAGNGKTFTVNSGGSATMIAGQNIVYLPGTTVNYEGYLHGVITTIDEYCLTLNNPLVNKAVTIGGVQETAPELLKNKNVRLYPNPAHGTFTLELTANTVSEMTKVEMFGMNGVKVLSEVMAGERKHIFTVESLRPGIYIIHVISGSASETRKLIKLE